MPGFFLYEDYILKSLIERLETTNISQSYKDKLNSLTKEQRDFVDDTKELLLESSKRLYHLDLYLCNEMNQNDLDNNMKNEWINFVRLSNIRKI